MQYFKLKITYKEETVSIDTHFLYKGVIDLIKGFDKFDRKHEIVSWTVYEYSDGTFSDESLTAESGSSHPINASAIFYDLFAENIDLNFLHFA